MEKPVKRTKEELLKPDFVDFLFATYEPKKNSAGEYFHNGLDYLTNETSYMMDDAEKQFISEHGLAPIGFLELLRVQMAQTSGFGICVNNNDLKKAILSFEIDYELDPKELNKFYDELVEHQIILIITGSTGVSYATTIQQVFNWEYKMWSRWTNNEYQKKKRKKSNNEASEDDENKSDELAPERPLTEEPPSEPISMSSDEDEKEWF